VEYQVRIEKGDTLGTLLERAGRLFPSNEACVQGSVRIYYDAYIDRINCMGNGLLKLGLAKGEKVAIFMPSSPEWLYAQWAAVKLGAPIVPINTRFKQFEVEYLLKQSDATTLFIMDKFLKKDYIPMFYEIIPELRACKPNELISRKLPMLKRVIVLGEKNYDGVLDYGNVLKLGKDHAASSEYKKAQEAVTPEDVYQIAYTSGTTGTPKGVVHTHYQWMRNHVAYAIRCGFSNRSRILTVSPFTMGMGNNGGFMPCSLNGGCVLPMQAFDPGEALRLIDEEKVTFFCGSPTMYIMMMNHPDFPKRNTRSIKAAIVGGADVSPQLVRDMKDKMGIEDVMNAY
jgi:fatty-acyl-CoA synthase